VIQYVRKRESLQPSGDDSVCICLCTLLCHCVVQYHCSSSTGLTIILYGGTKLQCLYTGHELGVSVASKDWLHHGTLLCPACDEICQVWCHCQYCQVHCVHEKTI